MNSDDIVFSLMHAGLIIILSLVILFAYSVRFAVVPLFVCRMYNQFYIFDMNDCIALCSGEITMIGFQ
jgi:ABC-type uncharacterized transport system permease subunit